jgi:hypothetical protein
LRRFVAQLSDAELEHRSALEAKLKPMLLRRLAPAAIPARAREPLVFCEGLGVHAAEALARNRAPALPEI